MTYAKIIADSISPEGVRLTTMEVRLHRFVLAELNTHRVLNKNSASSRAIPLAKQLARVKEDPAIPVVFPAEQKGMQGGEALADQDDARRGWLRAAKDAAKHAQWIGEMGVHKSIANRLLEPFMWHTVVLTGTAWENFFAQRCSPLAQPEIRVAAEMMREAYDDSEPRKLTEGNWHLPYVWDDEDTLREVSRRSDEAHPMPEGPDGSLERHQAAVAFAQAHYGMLAQISAARCARVSYLTQDGKRDIEQDLALYERLTTAEPPHWSPLEHVATPWAFNRQEDGAMFTGLDGERRYASVSHLPKVGNLLGWRSLRTEVEAQKGAVTYR